MFNSKFFTSKVIFITGNASISSFFLAYALYLFNPTQKAIIEEGKWDNEKVQVSMITSFAPLGAALGCIIAGFFANIYGRRKTLMVSAFIGILTCFCSIEPKFEILLAVKFIQGILAGINSTIVPVYNSEISPPEIYRFIGIIHSLSGSLGVLTIFVFSYLEFHWKFMNIFPAFLLLIQIFLFSRFIKEDTPHFLISKGRYYNLDSVLLSLYKEDHIVEIKNRLFDEIKVNPTNVGFLELFNYKYKDKMIKGATLAILQQLTGYGAILFYSSKIIDDQKEAVIFSMIIGILLVCTSILSGFLMKCFSQKKLFFGGFFMCGICMFCGAIFTVMNFTKALPYFFLCFVFNYGATVGPILWVMLPAFLPPSGCSLATMINWMTTFLIGFAFPYIREIFNLQGCFLMFSLFNLFAALYTIFILEQPQEIESKTKNYIEVPFIKEVNEENEQLHK